MYLEKKTPPSIGKTFILSPSFKKKLILNPLSKYLLTYLNHLLPQS